VYLFLKKTCPSLWCSLWAESCPLTRSPAITPEPARRYYVWCSAPTPPSPRTGCAAPASVCCNRPPIADSPPASEAADDAPGHHPLFGVDAFGHLFGDGALSGARAVCANRSSGHQSG